MDAFDDEQFDDLDLLDDDDGDDEAADEPTSETFAMDAVDEVEAQKAASAQADALLARWNDEDVDEPRGLMGPQPDLDDPEMSDEQREQVRDLNSYFGTLVERRAQEAAEVEAVHAREAQQALERLSPAERAELESYEAIDYGSWDAQSILDLAQSVETGVPMRGGQIVSDAEFAMAMARAMEGAE